MLEAEADGVEVGRYSGEVEEWVELVALGMIFWSYRDIERNLKRFTGCDGGEGGD